MPAPKSLSSAQKPVMTGPGTPYSFSARANTELILFELALSVGDAVARDQLAAELDEALAEERLATVARDDALDRASCRRGRPRAYVGVTPCAAASRRKSRSQFSKLPVFWQLEGFAAGGVSAAAVAAPARSRER